MHLVEGSWQNNKNDFLFPILFNTIVEKNLFASKFSPLAGVSRSPAIYMINHNNDIFVQMKRGESLEKLVSLMVKNENRRVSTREEGATHLLFEGLIDVLAEQANAEDILLELALDCTQGSSVQRFRDEETEWSLLGGYGYFLTKTVALTLYTLSLAMTGAGAITALSFISWVVKTVIRFSKTGYDKSGLEDG